MLELHQVDTVTIHTRRHPNGLGGPLEILICAGQPGLGPRSLTGQTVLLDGKLVKVLGIESYATLHDPVGSNFGIVVEDVKLEKGAE